MEQHSILTSIVIGNVCILIDTNSSLLVISDGMTMSFANIHVCLVFLMFLME